MIRRWSRTRHLVDRVAELEERIAELEEENTGLRILLDEADAAVDETPWKVGS